MSGRRTLAVFALGWLLCTSAQALAETSRFDAVRQLPATEWQLKGGGPRSLWCPKTAAAPVLDGKLDDACWAQAGKARPFIKSDGGMSTEVPADYPTQVLVCRDDANFYMAWTVTGAVAKEIASSTQDKFRNDVGNYRDFYSTTFQMLDGDNWYRFMMNSKANAASDSFREAKDYTGTFSAKSAPTADGAIIEVAIPFSNPGLHVPKDGEWWKIRLNRVSNYEWSAHNIEDSRFDYLFFGEEPAYRAAALPISPRIRIYGDRYVYCSHDVKTQFMVAVRGNAPADGSVLIQCLKGDEVIEKREVAQFKEPHLAFLFDPRGLAVGDYRMQVTLRNPAGQKVLEDAWTFSISDRKEEVLAFPADGVSIVVEPREDGSAGVWPVSTGVPLPRDAVRDVTTLGLFEDGVRIAANIVPRAAWHPTLKWTGGFPAIDEGNSIQWVGVSFNARYVGGAARSYVLKKVTDPVVPATTLKVNEDDKSLTIDTGPARLVLSKTAFTGIEAWLDNDGSGTFSDNEKLLFPGDGPFVVDQNKKRYTGANDRKPKVAVEEAGPARVVVAVRGWHYDAEGKPLCLYETRVIAFAGMPYFEVRHRTVLTMDNRELKLEDIGFALKTPRPRKGTFGSDDQGMASLFAGMESQSFEGSATGWWSTCLHQDRNDHFRFIYEWMDESGKVQQSMGGQGRRADGQASAVGESSRVSVMLRHIWEKYPKELEVGSEGITLHFWPRHGYDTFSADEQLGREHLHKLRFAHMGRLLDLQIPESLRQRIAEVDAAMPHRTDGPRESLYGSGSPGRGVVISNEFFVLLEGPSPGAPPITANLVRQNPGANSDPTYACATNVLGRMHPVDTRSFPRIENAIRLGNLAHYRFFELADSWGMFTFAGHHANYTPGVNYPTSLARLWSNSHYQDVSLGWLLYFRSGDPEFHKWARAVGEHHMTIGTCNYDDPEKVLIGSNPDGTTKGFHVPLAGQMFHNKSPAPWGGPLASNGHFIDPQAYFMRYCLEGDYAARDNFEQWGRILKRTPVDMNPHRDTNTTIAHLLMYYTWSWDPYALILIHDSAEALLNTPFARHDAGHFHKYWIPRYFELTRDPRAMQRTKEWVETNGQVDAPAMALMFRETGDRKYLPILDHGPATYDNPGDPWHGYAPGAYQPYGGFLYSALPGGMHALAAAKLTEDSAAPLRGLTPQGGADFKDRSGATSRIELLLLEKQDRAFDLVLENAGVNEEATTVQLLGRDGKPLIDPIRTQRDGRYRGAKIIRVTVPKDGKTGLHQIPMSGGHCLSFFMPATDLAGEAAVLLPEATYALSGPMYSMSLPRGVQSPVVLQFTAKGVGTIRIDDDKGAAVLRTSIATGLMRQSAEVRLDPQTHPQPWRLQIDGDVQMRMTHGPRLFLGPDKARVMAIVEAGGK